MALKKALKKAIYLNNMLQYVNKALSLKYSIKPPKVFKDNNNA